MKKINYIFVVIFVLFSFKSFSQEGYKFTDEFRLQVTSVKNQNRSGTCWSFSGLAFIEAEMVRMGKKEIPDLSEMFVVRHCYMDKAVKAVRMHGHFNFGGGGAFHDVTYVIKNYGMVPDLVCNGLQYGESNHVHGELDEILSNYVKSVIKNKNRKLSTAWKNGFNSILDAYLGVQPKKFDYNGNTYSPKSFAKEIIGVNINDYVELGSYTHHPFYSKFIIEIPDNWMWDYVYNVRLNELKEIIDNALDNKYPVGWASDVSEKGFSYRNGIAIIPDHDLKEMNGSEKAKWEKLSKREKDKLLYKFDKPGVEKTITQEMRQDAFDNYQTTDDHAMLILGKAKDQKGNKYYIVKNSWGKTNKYKGYFYASEAFVLYKTISVMVHKNAIPKKILKKLKIK